MASVPFNNLITFSRGSNATVTGSNGLIQWAPNNLLTFSEQFDNAAWLKVNATITANTVAAPDGTTTADRLVNTGLWGLDQAATLVAGIRYVISVWVKSGGTGKDTFILYGDGTQASGTLTATSSWVRVEHSFVATVSGARGNGIFRDSSNNPVDIYLWGAQLELGSAATTYNSTTVKNLLGFSEAFDNAAWTKTNASIVTGAQANPVNGAFNAQKLMEDTVATVPHGFASANVTTIIGTPMTSAFYAKAAGRSWVVANAFNAANKRCWFDLANGTTGTTAAGCTTSITSVGNGWYRCAVIQTAAATTMSLGLYASTADGTLSYTGDGNSGIYIYGAQLSDSASLDPYVPTPAAAPSSTAYYGPRFDYDPVTLAPKGLLVEEARTNLITYSDQFDNAAWTKASSSISANSTTAPDGTLTADKLQVANTSSAQKNVSQTVGAISTTYADTVYAKAAELSWLIINQYDGVDRRTSFNLSNGTVGTTAAGTTATIEALPNGWYRCRAVRLTGTGSIQLVINVADADNNAVFVGTVGQGIFIWGAQREAGAFATSYIPTVASTVTRSADVATINGSLFSQWYGQSEGTFIWEYSRVAPPNGGRIFASGVGGSNSYGIWVNTATGSQDQITVRDISGDAVAGALFTVNSSSVNNGAVAYRVNDFAWASNGAAPATDSTGVVPSLSDQLRFGRAINTDASFINGHIRSIDYIPTRIADFQLQALTL